jgi:tRNA threonylcarbamoyl adenosine modification protein YeaZ
MVGTNTQDIVHLAIETTGRAGSLALMRGIEVVESLNLAPGRRTASSLAPQLEQLLERCRRREIRIGLVSIADGPGSFTGLRIGVTTAKTLGYALRIPLAAVDSLAAIAATVFHEHPDSQSLCVALDAYRGQVFTGRFRRRDLVPELDGLPEDWTAHPATVEVIGLEQWQQRLDALPGAFDIAAVDSGAVDIAGDSKALGSRAATGRPRTCDAIGVGLLGIRAFQAGLLTEPMDLVPRYLKPSAAEEKAGPRR